MSVCRWAAGIKWTLGKRSAGVQAGGAVVLLYTTGRKKNRQRVCNMCVTPEAEAVGAELEGWSYKYIWFIWFEIHLDFFYLIFFFKLSMFLRPSWLAKFWLAAALASWQPVVQREDDLPPSWSKLASVPASLTWQCFQSVRLFFFLSFFLFLDRLSLFHKQWCHFRQKKR